MIGLTMLGGYALVAVVAAIGSVTGAAILEGLMRLNRCCMSARTVIAAVARVEQPQTFEQIVQHLIDDYHAEAIKEAGRAVPTQPAHGEPEDVEGL